jgi:protein-S-isoprenylcysteine O-methyltransferase Ste14
MNEDTSSLWRSAAKVAGATALWATAHSLLADDRVKERVGQVIGHERRAAFFRVFYNVQAVLSFGALLLYFARQPGRVLYEARGKSVWLFRAGQAASVLYGVWAALQLPVTHFSGLLHAWSYLTGKKMPREAEAQGPTVEEDGSLRATGPFRLTRHPLNLAPLGVFWLWPKMTSKRFAFNVVATLYNVYGSMREEKHLLKASEQYGDYQKQVPFFLPWPKRDSSENDRSAS